ncbi:MAG: KOW domain-containing RNA-binding protein [Clostridia bacterium]|nr:KOW domain-containing RNA-binding protein [Clostridia bacterium]
MKVKIPVIGGICQSTQGRDKDRYYIIRKIFEDGTVGVVDGNFRKLASPKKKNLKHLRLLPDKAEIISAKFADGRQVFDTEIYSALKPYNNPQPEQSEEKQVSQ